MKEIIDSMVNELVERLKTEVGYSLESIILFGSYTQGKMSLERPNVNMLIITKKNVSGDEYIKIGQVFYKIVEKIEVMEG
jgi:predicted nucleotidyltransferase